MEGKGVTTQEPVQIGLIIAPENFLDIIAFPERRSFIPSSSPGLLTYYPGGDVGKQDGNFPAAEQPVVYQFTLWTQHPEIF